MNTMNSNSKKCHKYKQSIKLRLIELYGSRCCKCGYGDSRALQLDHINGATVHQKHYRRGGNGLYFLVLNGLVPKTDYQLLCANCNWIKRYEAKETWKNPHGKIGKPSASILQSKNTSTAKSSNSTYTSATSVV